MKKLILPLLIVSLITSVVFYFDNKMEVKQEQQQIATNYKNDDTITNLPKEIEEENSNHKEIIDNENIVDYIDIAIEDVRIPILMYHSISNEDPDNSLLVPPSMFDEQMAWLANNNFTAMSLDDVLDSMTTGKLPKRPVVVTFDDGYADNYTEAFPILKKHNLKGTFFIITDYVDQDSYYMSSDMLKEMNQAGMEIENHTSNHLELNQLSKEDQIASINNGQTFLRNVIGVDANYLCYPVGKYDDITLDVSKELGIKAAVTTQSGISSTCNGAYELKRMRLSPMSMESFAYIFSEYME